MAEEQGDDDFLRKPLSEALEWHEITSKVRFTAPQRRFGSIFNCFPSVFMDFHGFRCGQVPATALGGPTGGAAGEVRGGAAAVPCELCERGHRGHFGLSFPLIWLLLADFEAFYKGHFDEILVDVQALSFVRCSGLSFRAEASQGGQWVLLLLYCDAQALCEPLMALWASLARRYPLVKFLRGVASEIIESFPEHLTPTVIVYRDEECVAQVQGLADWGGHTVTMESMAQGLARLGVVQLEEEVEEEEEGTTDDRGYGSQKLDRILRGQWS